MAQPQSIMGKEKNHFTNRSDWNLFLPISGWRIRISLTWRAFDLDPCQHVTRKFCSFWFNTPMIHQHRPATNSMVEREGKQKIEKKAFWRGKEILFPFQYWLLKRRKYSSTLRVLYFLLPIIFNYYYYTYSSDNSWCNW